MISRNDPCWCKSGKKWKKCHWPEPPPVDAFPKLQALYKKQYGILLKTDEQIAGIRKSCQLASFILNELCLAAKKGVTTNALNDLAMKLHKEHNATPAPLHYGSPPFPKAICTSLNDVICHGIPNDTPLKDGDIVNIDVTCILDGYYGDCSRMVCVGKISPDKQLVVDTSKECLEKAIAVVKPGVLIKEVGNAIENHAHAKSCSVVYQFVGHGVGVNFHEAPQIPHHKNNNNIPFAPGMTFTIEPMINRGVASGWLDSQDGWTARTEDGLPSAQWEHTLLVTIDGAEILTNIPT